MSDKLKHFFACMTLVFCISLTLFLTFGVIAELSLVFGVITSALISLAKEIYDVVKPNPTGFDVDDLIADSFGALFGVILFIIITMAL